MPIQPLRSSPLDPVGVPAEPLRPDPWQSAPAPPIEFRIRSEAEAEVLCRLLGLFAQLDLVPQHMHLERHGHDLHLALRFAGLSLHRAGVIADKLRGLVCIWQVDWHINPTSG
ncbi:hypothetical protein [Pseudomonas sp. GD03944]|uniref:hypothetical protein n=1 Tax=Pseudomonas sp. GD03944 TaxID=2975409 RepID=UPI0024478438|nr:hypothetical protein [Pseudomonas sp. GD03944]MDH1264518.1 hypothetical protein [Pseudomonas sp. GD03944]